MFRLMLAMGALLVVAPVAVEAQEQDTATATSTRQQVEERFAQRVREELGLTDDETQKLRTVARGWFDKRRALEAEERALRQALAGQLRPGIAANSDSVTKLTQRLLDLKVTYAETYRQENRELGFLTPVQRAQYYSLRERLLQIVRESQYKRKLRHGGT